MTDTWTYIERPQRIRPNVVGGDDGYLNEQVPFRLGEPHSGPGSLKFPLHKPEWSSGTRVIMVRQALGPARHANPGPKGSRYAPPFSYFRCLKPGSGLNLINLKLKT